MAKKKTLLKVEYTPVEKPKIEFSKIILFMVMMMFFVVTVIGAYLCVFVDFSVYSVLCTFVAPSIVTALAFYSWKAKNENVEKIKQSNTDNEEVEETSNIDG